MAGASRYFGLNWKSAAKVLQIFVSLFPNLEKNYSKILL